MTRFSAWNVLWQGVTGQKGGTRQWRDPEPKSHYDVIIGGGGNAGRYTTIVCSNYARPVNRQFYAHSLKQAVPHLNYAEGVRFPVMGPRCRNARGRITAGKVGFAVAGKIWRLAGIFPKDRSKTFNGGAPLCLPEEGEGFGEGWVTAVKHSPALGHWIGLSYVAGGHGTWAGRALVASDPVRGAPFKVEVVSPHMFDPEGERMHG